FLSRSRLSPDCSRPPQTAFDRAGEDPCVDSSIYEVRQMATGTVKWFNTTKGYGFIQPDDGGADVFVHISAVERSGLGNVREGQKLAYELEKDRKSGKFAAGALKAL